MNSFCVDLNSLLILSVADFFPQSEPWLLHSQKMNQVCFLDHKRKCLCSLQAKIGTPSSFRKGTEQGPVANRRVACERMPGPRWVWLSACAMCTFRIWPDSSITRKPAPPRPRVLLRFQSMFPGFLEPGGHLHPIQCCLFLPEARTRALEENSARIQGPGGGSVDSRSPALPPRHRAKDCLSTTWHTLLLCLKTWFKAQKLNFRDEILQ